MLTTQQMLNKLADNSLSATCWLLSTGTADNCPDDGTITAEANAAAAMTDAPVYIGFTCNQLMVRTPIDLVVSFYNGDTAMGKMSVQAGEVANFNVTFDSIRLTSTAGLASGQIELLFQERAV